MEFPDSQVDFTIAYFCLPWNYCKLTAFGHLGPVTIISSSIAEPGEYETLPAAADFWARGLEQVRVA